MSANNSISVNNRISGKNPISQNNSISPNSAIDESKPNNNDRHWRSIVKTFSSILAFLLTLSLSPNALAVLVEVDGDVRTKLIPYSSVNQPDLQHEVSFRIKDPIDCNGIPSSRLFTYNGYVVPGNLTTYKSLNHAVLGKSLSTFYVSSKTAVDVTVRVQAYVDGESVCVVDLNSAYKDTSNLADAPQIDAEQITGERAVAVTELRFVAYRNPIAHTDPKESYLKQVVLTTRETVECQGEVTNNLLINFKGLSEVSQELPNFEGRDNILMATLNDFVAVKTGAYHQDTTGGYSGCVLADLRTLSSEELGDVGNAIDGYGTGFSDGVLACQENPNDCGLFSGDDVDVAYNTGFSDGNASGFEEGRETGFSEGYAQGSEAGISQGKEACQSNPESCDLISQAEHEQALSDAFSEGRQACISNPASCQLYSSIQLINTFNSGYNLGLAAGKNMGIEQGLAEGMQMGYDNGFNDGKKEGYQEGYDEGLAIGITDGTQAGIAQ